MKISIFSVDLFGMRYVKDIDIYDSLKMFFESKPP